MQPLNDVVFYHLEKAIKSYRQYAQSQIDDAGFDITIDQWLLLNTIEEDPAIPQQQIAAKLFKDVASITRMIELLVKKEYLERGFHDSDRRRFQLSLTKKGKNIIAHLKPLIERNRSTALKNVNKKETEQLSLLLNKIINNCSQ
jgi:MarR family transcriptional regulator, transcriptional regulator for hemolysin